MARRFTMKKTAFIRYLKKDYIPRCRQCGKFIELGDEFVNTTQYGRISKHVVKLYCIPCADTLNII